MAHQPIDLNKAEAHCSNLYEAVVIAARKARYINDQNKIEYNTMLSALAPSIEEEFDERENPEQLKISLEFENRKKPHESAMQELIDGDIGFRYKDSLIG